MPEVRSKKNKYLSYLLRFGVAGGALYLAFRGENLTEVVAVFKKLGLWVWPAALGLYIIAQFIFVLRWRLLMRVQSIRIGYWSCLRLHFLGLFYNNCLPSSVGGDLLRVWYVTKHTDKKLEAALSVFVDRAVGLLGMLIMAFCCYWFIPAETQKGRFEFPYKIDFLQRLSEVKRPILATGAVAVAVLAVLLLSPKVRGLLVKALKFVREHGALALRGIRDAIYIYWNKLWAILLALLLTFVLQGICIIAMWLFGREIGMNVHFKYYFIFFPVSWLLGALPISIGGAGIMELWLKDIFVRVCAVTSKDALVLAFCQRLMWLFGSLPGAVIHLVGAHLPKDFFIDCDKSTN